jgi:hypothetical protein
VPQIEEGPDHRSIGAFAAVVEASGTGGLGGAALGSDGGPEGSGVSAAEQPRVGAPEDPDARRPTALASDQAGDRPPDVAPGVPTRPAVQSPAPSACAVARVFEAGAIGSACGSFPSGCAQLEQFADGSFLQDIGDGTYMQVKPSDSVDDRSIGSYSYLIGIDVVFSSMNH